MRSHIIQVADDFWNVRGSFKIGGVVDIGTQASLVRRGNGKFVFLDSYTLSGDVEREVLALTNGGKDVEAILNVHPFHTVFARKMHERFPHAKLYGTERHLSRSPELPWEGLCTEDSELHAMFADDFEFSVPRGVDFISTNENVHFSSVLVLHRASSPFAQGGAVARNGGYDELPSDACKGSREAGGGRAGFPRLGYGPG